MSLGDSLQVLWTLAGHLMLCLSCHIPSDGSITDQKAPKAVSRETTKMELYHLILITSTSQHKPPHLVSFLVSDVPAMLVLGTGQREPVLWVFIWG